jgi:hypothetical protein
MELQATLQQIATRYNYKLDEIKPGTFRMDIAVPLKDGKFRYQFVYIWKIQEPSGRERIYMNSRCGTYTPQLNLYNILKESALAITLRLQLLPTKMPMACPAKPLSHRPCLH